MSLVRSITRRRIAKIRRWEIRDDRQTTPVLLVFANSNVADIEGRIKKNQNGLEYTGIVLPPISIEERLLDLDGDGHFEYVRSGGESLIAKYARIRITDK